MNPYRVPGLTGPNGVLCPFKKPDHDDYYVPVDNTQKAYEQFTEEIDDPHRLSTDGLLVVVSGEQHCGKTALINRCAAWLRRRLNDVDLQGHIFQLTRERIATRSIETRLAHVFDCISDDLGHRRLLGEDQLRELANRKNDLERAFRYLSDILDQNRVLIIVLPPSADLIKEAERYANFSRGKIVFFAESSYVDIVRHHWPSIRSAGPAAPILLEVGPLHEDDSWFFAHARQEIHRGQSNASPFLKVTKESMKDLTAGRIVSIGEMQKFLHWMYDNMKSQPHLYSASPSDEVTTVDILKAFIRWTGKRTGDTR
jgi:hypothetical protein